MQDNLKKLKRDVWRNPWVFIGSGFGIGLIPFAPGTFATMGGMVIYLLMARLVWWQYAWVATGVILLSISLSDYCSKKYKLHDPVIICLDEFAGFLVTMFLVPTSLSYLLGGFVLFRLFDIWKPWIIGTIDKKMDSGFGMVLDDLVAGFFAWVVLQVAALVVPHI